MIWRAALFLVALAAPAQAGPVFFAVLSAGGGFGAAIAATSVGAFLSTTVGRLLVSVAVSALSRALAPKPRDPGLQTRVTQAGGVNAASFILGRYATAGSAVCPPMSHGTNNNELTFVIDVSDMPVTALSRVVIDGEYAEIGTTPDGDGFLPLLGRFVGRGSVKLVDGRQTAADPWLLATYGGYPERPWSAEMIGLGVAYVILRFSYNREVYQGLPQVRFEIDGIPLYDPRLDSTVGGAGPQRWADPSTWAFSANPAVMIYNIRRGITLGDGSVWGREAAVELPLSSWFAAMNECDAAIDIGGDATEPQFRAGFEVTVSTEPAEVIEELQKACNGAIVEQGGICKMRVGPPGLPVYFFTDEDMLVSRPEELDPFPGLDQTWNAVHASYPEPESLWEPRDAPPRYDAAAEAEDGGRRLVAELSLPAVPYGGQVQRIMRAVAQDHRRMRRHSVSLRHAAVILEPLDTVAWTSARNGYAGKLFEVGEVAEEILKMVPTVALREVDPTDHDWEPGFALPSDPAPAVVVVPAAPVVTGFAATPVEIGDGGAPRRPGIRLDWDAASGAGARALEWELRPAGGATILRGSTDGIDQGTLTLTEGVAGLADLIPGFATGADYTLGIGISVTGGEAVVIAAAGNRRLIRSQALIAGQSYRVRFTVAGRTGGSVIPQLAGTTTVNGTTRNANGTYEETMVAAAGNNEIALQFNAPAAMRITEWSVRRFAYEVRARWVSDQPGAWTSWAPVLQPTLRLGQADLGVGAVDTQQMVANAAMVPFGGVVLDTSSTSLTVSADITGIVGTIPVFVQAATIAASGKFVTEFSTNLGVSWAPVGDDDSNRYIGGIVNAPRGELRVRVRLDPAPAPGTPRRISILAQGMKR